MGNHDQDERRTCDSPRCGCGPQPVSIGRRDFLAAAGLGAASVLVPDWPAVAGPFEEKDFEQLVPRDKKLNPDWVRKLTERGKPETYRGAELDWIGMPVGGIACGQLYLGGDGRLWYWDIFTSTTTTDYEAKIWAGPHYEHPLRPKPVVEQGFAIRVKQGEMTVVRGLDRSGFKDVTFRGEYPIGRVTYHDEAVPVDVSLEAFSPFIPLDVADSSLPATVLSYRVKNTGQSPVEVSLAGRLENAVCRVGDGGLNLVRRNSIERGAGGRTTLLGTVERVPEQAAVRPDIVFADFEGSDYGGWTGEGKAFDGRPYREDERRFYTALSGYEGKGFVNTHMMRHGEDAGAADEYKGKLTSPEFTIDRRFIHFRIGGGADANKLGLRLLIDGKDVRRAAGRGGGAMRRDAFDVREFQGKQARLQIVDDATGGWGHTTVDQIVFSDRPIHASPQDVPGYGSMALSLLDEDRGRLQMAADLPIEPDRLFDGLKSDGSSATKPLRDRLVGAVGRTLTIAPGESASFDFVLSWWFPSYGQVSGEMAAIAGSERLKRHYIRRFDGAGAVAAYVAEQFQRLSSQTRLWVQTWYDSTLPYWFLDRVMVPANTLATQTFHAFDSGRYWGWEGVDCCPGTCQHVWQYAQSVARLFPAIERDLRERVDFGLAWHENGAMDFRSENDRHVAHDGFCGTIVRAYREHQMAPDSSFLRKTWPRIRRSIEFILVQDRDGDGLLEGEQMNTLDTAWFGPMAWISSLYLAALSAGAAMADEMGDAAFAGRCRKVVEAGGKSLVAKLYNGEYFIHKPPDYTRNNTNIGCHSDQMLGQSMALQVGLPRFIGETEARSALRSLWRYNFTPDVGPYRERFKTIPGGRWYAMPGEGGLLVTTFPHGGADRATGKNSAFAFYFNECWTGFEYQVAAQMLWEGMVTEGLAIVRMIHDRYHPARRNPYNEIECSDHYSRAMASHGVLLAACGLEYHGPKGHLGFAPRVTPDDFRAPFTAAEGWGTISQKRDEKGQGQRVEVKYGRLRLKTLAFEVPEGRRIGSVKVRAVDAPIEASHVQEGRRVVVTLAREDQVDEGQALEVELS
jgi:non-lysosomal glucosylceramidase